MRRDRQEPDKDGDKRGLDRQHLGGGDKAVIVMVNVTACAYHYDDRGAHSACMVTPAHIHCLIKAMMAIKVRPMNWTRSACDPSCAERTSLSSGCAPSGPSALESSRCLNCAACASCCSSSSSSTAATATIGCGSCVQTPFLPIAQRTLVLAAIFGEVPRLAADEAALSADYFALVASAPATGVVLQLDLDLAAVQQDAVESGWWREYS